MGRVILCGIASLALAVAAPGPARGAPAKAPQVVGGELSQRGAEWAAGQSGAVIRLDDGVVLRFGPAARARKWPDARLPLGGGAATRAHVFGLLEGNLVVEDPPPTRRAKQAVLVQVPGGLSGVTAGGRLEAVTDGRSSAVANREGTAWASAGGGSRSLEPGTGWSTSKVEANPFSFAVAPEITAERRAFSGIRGSATIDGVHWSNVPGARGYVLRLVSKHGERAAETIETTGASQSRSFRDVPPGDYSATVAAIDEHGLEGRASASLALRVVGLKLSPGADMGPDGAVSIAERAAVHLTHADGLVVSYGSMHGWIPAPPQIRLFRDEPTIVHIRDPQDDTGFDIPLRPRRLAVHVSVGPKRLVWPGDPVRITIRASDGEGGAAPDTVELHPVVTLGIDEVPVQFARNGNTLTGEVPAPPAPGRGPWVVRVQVRDQFGNPVGRDFVEISRAPQKKRPHALQAEGG